MIRSCFLVLLLGSTLASAQPNRGELHVHAHTVAGTPLAAQVVVSSSANGIRQRLECDAQGRAASGELPFGLYQVIVEDPGFASVQKIVDVHTSVPEDLDVALAIAELHTVVKVSAAPTLLDPGSTTSAQQVGEQQMEQRLSSLPGRSVQDLVVAQPGWLYEGNGVLHPRGSEYQTQFVVDGIPLSDNRSPGFSPEIEANDLESITVYTAGYPAEYGRQMGGVIELNTREPSRKGTQGSVVLSGGSYDTMSAYGDVQESRGRTFLAVTAAGAQSARYLNPVVPQNYTNRATTAGFSARAEHTIGSSDRIDFSLRRDLARFLIPNEIIQQQAGQVQNGGTFETMGTGRYQHVVRTDSILVVSAMVRQNRSVLESNVHPYPIAAFQHNRFREGYLKATWALHCGEHEFKAGVESDNTFLNERFSYDITDPSQFNPGTPTSFSFAAHRPELDQAAFVEEQLRLHDWTLSLGLRWDHYQLLLNREAFSPRISVARFIRPANLVIHASYDRIFQTPSVQNILISSSPQVDALSPEFLRLPVQPSTGNYLEAGLSKSVKGALRVDVNVYRREANNFADDQQLLNTPVSYPIAFDHAAIHGAEAKLSVPHAGGVSGFVSYAWMQGADWLPVTGGLFLGEDASSAVQDLHGRIPNTQDQRNTLASRWLYSFGPRIRAGAGVSYGSGLPFQYGGTRAEALEQYGPAVVNRLDFSRGRVRPHLSANASLGIDVVRREHVKSELHVDGENLNGRLNVIDFGGLFSGNSIAPGRSVLLRLDTQF